MPYDFLNLSPADFEDLSLDLVGRELGVRFEAFTAGPDGGIDGRHSSDGNSTILQAKHYARSGFSALKSQMKREYSTVKTLDPQRYVLVTSCPITAHNKAELQVILDGFVSKGEDIKGPDDLNGLLRAFPDIEKAHVKLWLSSAAVLDRLVHSSAHVFNALTKEEIEAKIRVYAPNPSFDQALKVLEANHVLIISGPPGVGKTTLAEMLAYAFIAKDWELVSIRNLDDGFKLLSDSKKQVFFFDDFLGRVALDKQALAHKDSELARFIKRVRNSPNARFILTTRAYLFEEARRVSEHLADQRLDVSKFVLDVGVYSRKIKARILYNHLLIAGTPQSHINALATSGELSKIVDHKNYNPRVIEWMTDSSHIKDINAEDYTARFIAALDNPSALWDIAFRTHISKACQHLLFALFFCSQYGADLADLRASYESLHKRLCKLHGDVMDVKDFEESLKVLEGGFISIVNRTANFINPSLRDYLTTYLKDLTLLVECAKSAQRTDWTNSLWRFAADLPNDQKVIIAASLLSIAKQFTTLPVWKTSIVQGVTHYRPNGPSNTSRIELLLEWFQNTKDIQFWNIAVTLAEHPIDGLDSWRDGEDAVALIGRLRDGGYYDALPRADHLADHLEAGVISMLKNDMPLDELDTVADAIDSWSNATSIDMKDALHDAIAFKFATMDDSLADIDSESTLEDQKKSIRKLGERGGLEQYEIDDAIRSVDTRIYEVNESAANTVTASPHIKTTQAEEHFDNDALHALFSQLIQVSK